MVRYSVLAFALIVSFPAPAHAGPVYFVAARPDVAGLRDSSVPPLSAAPDLARARDDTVVAELPAAPAAPLPAALPTGAIGVVAVLVARWWPGAPWRGA